MIDRKEYSDLLHARKKESRVYQSFQATALALAEILEDKDHVSLYMRLAKKYNNQDLIRIAKTVAEKKEIENKGGYFMTVLKKSDFFNT